MGDESDPLHLPALIKVIFGFARPPSRMEPEQ